MLSQPNSVEHHKDIKSVHFFQRLNLLDIYDSKNDMK